jgi:hypothetical protein
VILNSFPHWQSGHVSREANNVKVYMRSPAKSTFKDLQEVQIQHAVSTAVISYAAAHPNKARRSPLHWTESVDPPTSHVVYGQYNSRRKELKQWDCRAFQAYAQLIGRIN